MKAGECTAKPDGESMWEGERVRKRGQRQNGRSQFMEGFISFFFFKCLLRTYYVSHTVPDAVATETNLRVG